MTRYVWLVCIVCALRTIGYAQLNFIKYYGNSNASYVYHSTPTQDGGFLLGTIDYSQQDTKLAAGLIKTNAQGQQLWTKAFRHFESSYVPYVAEGLDGSIYFAAAATQGMNPTQGSVMLVKLTANGDLIWSKLLQSSGFDFPAMLKTMPNGHLALLVNHHVNSGLPTTSFIELDTAGTLMQHSSYAFNGGFLRGVDMEFLADGSRYIVCVSSSINTFNGTTVLKTHPDGSIIWSYLYRGLYDVTPHACTSDGIDKLYITGQIYSTSFNWDAFIYQIMPDGLPGFTYTFDAVSYNGEMGRDITLIPGGVAICGDLGGFDERTPFLAAIDWDGNWLARGTYPVNPMVTNYAVNLHYAADGGYYITGDMSRPQVYKRNPPLLKTDQNGTIACYSEDFSADVKPGPIIPLMHVATQISEPLTISNLQPESLPFLSVQKDICGAFPPVAQFDTTWQPDCPTGCMVFENTTQGDVTQTRWIFEGGEPEIWNTATPPPICYSNSGTFAVTLIATNLGGSDTLIDSITVNLTCDVTIPNVFTPNADGTNDQFGLTGLPAQFSLHIYNRWGTLMFSTNQAQQMWDGQTPWGEAAPEGVYYYVYSDAQSNSKGGFLTLLRP